MRDKYGFVCIVTGAAQPVGKAIVTELAGILPIPSRACYLERPLTSFSTWSCMRLWCVLASSIPLSPAEYTTACSDNLADDFTPLATEINKQYPNTKVIGYPYKYASEEETLALIDDVLNQWGR